MSFTAKFLCATKFTYDVVRLRVSNIITLPFIVPAMIDVPMHVKVRDKREIQLFAHIHIFNVTLVKVCKLNSGIARRKYRAFEISTEACKTSILTKRISNFSNACTAHTQHIYNMTPMRAPQRGSIRGGYDDGHPQGKNVSPSF